MESFVLRGEDSRLAINPLTRSGNKISSSHPGFTSPQTRPSYPTNSSGPTMALKKQAVLSHDWPLPARNAAGGPEPDVRNGRRGAGWGFLASTRPGHQRKLTLGASCALVPPPDGGIPLFVSRLAPVGSFPLLGLEGRAHAVPSAHPGNVTGGTLRLERYTSWGSKDQKLCP